MRYLNIIMNKINILKKELKDNLKGLIIWLLIIIVMFTCIFIVYPSLNINEDEINAFMSSFPKELLMAFNMDINSIADVYGWFKSEGLMLLQLIGGAYIVLLGAGLISKEYDDKTITFLSIKPISKAMIYFSKLIAGLINVVVFTLIIAAVLYFQFEMYSNAFNEKEYVLLMSGVLLINIVIYFISLLISACSNKVRTSNMLSLGYLFLSYMLVVIGTISDKLSFIKYFSCFEWMNVRDITLNHELDLSMVGLSVVVILISIFIGLKLFNQKECKH